MWHYFGHPVCRCQSCVVSPIGCVTTHVGIGHHRTLPEIMYISCCARSGLPKPCSCSSKHDCHKNWLSSSTGASSMTLCKVVACSRRSCLVLRTATSVSALEKTHVSSKMPVVAKPVTILLANATPGHSIATSRRQAGPRLTLAVTKATDGGWNGIRCSVSHWHLRPSSAIAALMLVLMEAKLAM